MSTSATKLQLGSDIDDVITALQSLKSRIKDIDEDLTDIEWDDEEEGIEQSEPVRLPTKVFNALFCRTMWTVHNDGPITSHQVIETVISFFPDHSEEKVEAAVETALERGIDGKPKGTPLLIKKGRKYSSISDADFFNADYVNNR
jgi:hypothetical protein